MTQTTDSIDLHISCGFPNKDKIVIEGKGNEHPDYLAGDLVVIVTVAEDNIYKRVNNDLYITQKISLIESLSGFSFNFKHINEEVLTIDSQKGNPICHN